MSRGFNNFVAKHMETFNRPSVEIDKRSKYLDDAYEKELDDELTEEHIEKIRLLSEASKLSDDRITRSLFK